MHTSMLSLYIIAFINASLSLAQQLSGYELATQMLGEETNDTLVQNAWNYAYEQDPELVLSNLQSAGPQATHKQKELFRPIINQRTDWQIKVRHKDMPDYMIRARRPKHLGIDKVEQVSGYIDVISADKHFFFWLFESRNDPENDPVVLWLNGGPGCASSTGLFTELGPAMIQDDLTFKRNPYSWNNNATVIFLDQPVNVGFSYSSEPVQDSRAAAQDVVAFLRLLITGIPKFQNCDLHIAGESYAGHYIPAIGHEIISHPRDLNFKLKSLMIGNGLTDPANQMEARITMACGEGGYPSVLDSKTCDELYRLLPRCQRLSQICTDTNVTISCLGAFSFCSLLSAPYYKTGRSPYDIREHCSTDCTPMNTAIQDYMNQTNVKHILGSEALNYLSCSKSVQMDFIKDADEQRSYAPDVAAVLEKGVPVLIYSGDKDYICNWLGGRDWTNRLQWKHHDSFSSKHTMFWEVNNGTAGEGKHDHGLTFLRVYNAGHMVPYQQPAAAFEMLTQWINGGIHFK